LVIPSTAVEYDDLSTARLRIGQEPVDEGSWIGERREGLLDSDISTLLPSRRLSAENRGLSESGCRRQPMVRGSGEDVGDACNQASWRDEFIESYTYPPCVLYRLPSY
jgi:hypothetical protein